MSFRDAMVYVTATIDMEVVTTSDDGTSETETIQDEFTTTGFLVSPQHVMIGARHAERPAIYDGLVFTDETGSTTSVVSVISHSWNLFVGRDGVAASEEIDVTDPGIYYIDDPQRPLPTSVEDLTDGTTISGPNGELFAFGMIYLPTPVSIMPESGFFNITSGYTGTAPLNVAAYRADPEDTGDDDGGGGGTLAPDIRAALPATSTVIDTANSQVQFTFPPNDDGGAASLFDGGPIWFEDSDGTLNLVGRTTQTADAQTDAGSGTTSFVGSYLHPRNATILNQWLETPLTTNQIVASPAPTTPPLDDDGLPVDENGNPSWTTFVASNRVGEVNAILVRQSVEIASGALSSGGGAGLPLAVGTSRIVGLADSDLDGDDDVFISGPGQEPFVLRLDSGAVSGQRSLGRSLSTFQAVGVADLNGDGGGDLLRRDRNTGRMTVDPDIGLAGTVRTQSGFLLQLGDTEAVRDMADIDGDGGIDLLIERNNRTVVYIPTTGNGIDAQVTGRGTTYVRQLPSDWQVIGAADMDGDGDSDVVVEDVQGRRVYVWEMENGSYVREVLYGRLTTSQTVMGLDDFNQDSVADLLVHTPDGLSLLETASAGLTLAQTQSGLTVNLGTTSSLTATQRSSGAIAVEQTDIGLDGFGDMLSVKNDNRLYYASLSMDGGATPQTIARGDESYDLRGVFDMNNDGITDIVWQDRASGAAVLWTLGQDVGAPQSTGAIELDEVSVLAARPRDELAAIDDFNGDGLGDVIWRSRTGNDVLLSLGTASGTSSLIRLGPMSYTQTELAATGDFDGNGTADILWRRDDGRQIIWLVDDTGNVPADGMIYLHTRATDVRIIGAGDVDGDGTDDIVSVDGDGGVIIDLMLNARKFRTSRAIGTIPDGERIVGLSDVNGDQRADLVRANIDQEFTAWTLNGPDRVAVIDQGQFSQNNSFLTWAAPRAAGITDQPANTDIDGDGNGDAFVLNQGIGSAGALRITSGFATRNIPLANVSTTATMIGLGDINSDQKTDVVFQDPRTRQVQVWQLDGLDLPLIREIRLQGDDTTVPPAAAPALGQAVGDFNGDGTAELLMRSAIDEGPLVFWDLQGDGTAVQQAGPATTIGSIIIGVGDVNGDGTDDIVWRRRADNRVFAWEMEGSDVLREVDYGTAASGDITMGVGDTNSDGYDDLVWLNPATNEVTIWEFDRGNFESSVSAGNLPSGWDAVGLTDWNGDRNVDILATTSAGRVAAATLAFGEIRGTEVEREDSLRAGDELSIMDRATRFSNGLFAS